MKPLLQTVVALSLLLIVRALPENIEDVKQLPQSKEPVVEADESEPQTRVERCTKCGTSRLKIKSPQEIVAALQSLPGGEVHTQQSFEGCSSEKGCAGLKLKDGKVIEKYGNVDAINGAASADVNNEFNFQAGFANNVLGGVIPEKGPFWWMDQNSPFKLGSANGGSFEKYSKSSSSSYSNTGGGASLGGSLDLANNPFLNGNIAGQNVAAVKPNTFQSSSYESSSFSSSNKRDFDISKNPFLNGGFKAGQAGSAGFGSGLASAANQGFSASGAAQNFGASAVNSASAINSASAQGFSSSFEASYESGNKVTTGYTGSSPSPFAPSSINVVQNENGNEFDFEQQQQTQQNIDKLFQSSGSVGIDNSGGDLQQTCASEGYSCVIKSQCNNGVAYLRINPGKQYCNVRTEICCRIEIVGVASQGAVGVGSTLSQGSYTGQSSNGYKGTAQTNFIETDSLTAGSVNTGVYRPGAIGSNLKPGIPYLPPVDNSKSDTNIVGSTVFPTPTFVTTPKPFTRATYRPTPVTSTSAPGYLPPIGEQTINKETIVPNPNYSEGSLILDENIQPTRVPAPIDIPVGCAAALKCTPIEFCTADGIISNTTVILTRDQDAYRVPLTDCKDLETGRIGKCCRDPYYTDPWPTNQLGKWVPGVFGGNDGKYVPDSRGSSNNIRPTVTARPPVTGSVLLNNFRPSKPTVSPFGPNQVTPGFSTVTPTPFSQKGQFGVGGQGQFGIGGQGQYGQGSQGQFGVIGQGQIGSGSQVSTAYSQGQYGQKGQGSIITQGKGQVINQGQGQFISQGQGQIIKQEQGTYAQGGKTQFGVAGQGVQTQFGIGQKGIQGQGIGVISGQGIGINRGQGAFVSQGTGVIGSQGQGTLVSQGVGAFGSQGQGAFVSQGQGALDSQGQGTLISQGQGALVSQGQGTLVSQGQEALVSQAFGTGIRQGQGQYTSQGQGAIVSQGFGQGVRQGQGQYVSQGQGQLVSQGQGASVSQGQGTSVSQGFGTGIRQGQGQYTSQGQGAIFSQGFGQGVRQGQGQLVSQGEGQLVSQGQGQYFSQGQGQYVSRGQGLLVSQGFGQNIRQGQGFSVSQGSGVGVENDYAESVQRVFLQKYNGNGKCGLLNGQRPNGNRNNLEVDFAEIPWQAMVLLQTNKSLLCGGVITRPDVVVTSAACVEGLDAKNVLIKGGEWKLGIDDEPLPFQIVQVKTILRHPFYKPGKLLYDAAILVLTENLRFAKNIYPICLPGADETLDKYYSGAGQCIVTGWGKIVLQAHLAGSIMHSVNVSLLTPGDCQAKLSSDYPYLLNQYDEESCVCGEPSNPLDNICKVDIGSALACTTGDGHYVFRGVYSWDTGCEVGNQIAGFYRFDLEWYEWAIGLIESVRFAQFSTVTKITKVTGVKGFGGVKGSQFNFKGSSNSEDSGIKTGVNGFSVGKGQFGFGQGLLSQNQINQLNQFSSGSQSSFGTAFNFTEIKPITNGFSATYSENKVFQTEPKIITYTTKPEIVTYTTKPEIVTFTTKPEIVTYTTKPEIFTFTTKPKIFTYTTKPQIITYETSGSRTNPQYVAPGVSFNPSFSDLVGHQHTAKCKCLENKK